MVYGNVKLPARRIDPNGIFATVGRNILLAI